MQAAKDSFYRALQGRLSIVNPGRTIEVDGVARPAILVVENEPYPPHKLFFNTFYIHWLGAPAVREFVGTAAPRYEQVGQIEYFVQGTATLQRPFADRGRFIGQLDSELVRILYPGYTAKLNYTAVPPQSLESQVIWNWTPDLRTISQGEGSVLQRVATLNLSFYLETISN